MTPIDELTLQLLARHDPYYTVLVKMHPQVGRGEMYSRRHAACEVNARRGEHPAAIRERANNVFEFDPGAKLSPTTRHRPCLYCGGEL